MEYVHVLFEVIGAVAVGVLLGVAVDKILWKQNNLLMVRTQRILLKYIKLTVA